MTREPVSAREFIRAYCERSGVAWRVLHRRRRVMPCECGGGDCEGWAMVPLEFRSVNDLPPHRRRASAS